MQDRQCQPGGSAFQVCPLAHCLQRLPVPVMLTTPDHCCCGRRQKVGVGGGCKGPAPLLHSPPPPPPFLCLPQQQVLSTSMHMLPSVLASAGLIHYCCTKQQKALTGHHCMLFCLVYVMPLFTSTHDCSLAYNSARTTFMLQRLTVVA